MLTFPFVVIGQRSVSKKKRFFVFKIMSNKSPAFQFYPNDFLSDPKTLVMSAEEIGIYWLLVSVCWKENGLPKENKKLSRLARVQEKKFSRIWNDTISECFYFCEETQQYRHEGLDKEQLKQGENSEKRKQAADKRWCKTDANALQVHSKNDAKQCLSSSTSSSTSLNTQRVRLINPENENEIETYFSPLREILKTNTLPNEQRWLNAVLIAIKESLAPPVFAASLRELLAQDRKYPVTPENVINHAIEKRAKKSGNGFMPMGNPRTGLLSDVLQPFKQERPN